MTIMNKIKQCKLEFFYFLALGLFSLILRLTDMTPTPVLTFLLLAIGAIAISYPLFNRATTQYILMPSHQLNMLMLTYAFALLPALAINQSMPQYDKPFTPDMTLMHTLILMGVSAIFYCLISIMVSSLLLQGSLSADKADKATARFETEMRGYLLAKGSDMHAPDPAQYYRKISTNHLLAYCALSNMVNITAIATFIWTFDEPMQWPIPILIMLQLVGALAFVCLAGRPATLPLFECHD